MNKINEVILADNKPYYIDESCIVEVVYEEDNIDWKTFICHDLPPIPKGTKLKVEEVWLNYHGIWIGVLYNGQRYNLPCKSLKYVARET